jgi:hypothetical protein
VQRKAIFRIHFRLNKKLFMSLKALSLDPYLLAGLYPGPLISDRKHVRIRYSGKNRQHVLILYHFAPAQELPESHKNFLHKLILACKMIPDDLALVNTLDNPALEAIFSELNPKIALMFGVTPEAGLQRYSLVHYMGARVVAADNLEDIMENPSLKSKLWPLLRELFQV